MTPSIALRHLCLLLLSAYSAFSVGQLSAGDLFDKQNLAAWCIVPFDKAKRTPEARAEMVAKMGIKKVAYDWRPEHVAEFEREILAYQKHGIEMFAFWGTHDEAFRLQKDYYRRYGTSMRGLITEHGMKPDDFLDFVHQIDHSPLEPNPALGAALEALPGRKLILTNGTRKHADAITRRLGIHHQFEDVFDIVAGELEPKPLPQTYERLAPNLYRYSSDGGRFSALLETDDLGLVVHYEGGWERTAAA